MDTAIVSLLPGRGFWVRLPLESKSTHLSHLLRLLLFEKTDSSGGYFSFTVCMGKGEVGRPRSCTRARHDPAVSLPVWLVTLTVVLVRPRWPHSTGDAPGAESRHG